MPFSSGTLTIPAPSPQITMPGTESLAGIDQYPPEWLGNLPDLLDAQLPALRVAALDAVVLDGRLGQMAQRPLGEDRGLRHHVGARLEVGQRLAVAAPPLVARAHPAHDPVLDQKLV